MNSCSPKLWKRHRLSNDIFFDTVMYQNRSVDEIKSHFVQTAIMTFIRKSLFGIHANIHMRDGKCIGSTTQFANTRCTASLNPV